jgi:hypothetical protein
MEDFHKIKKDARDNASNGNLDGGMHDYDVRSDSNTANLALDARAQLSIR